MDIEERIKQANQRLHEDGVRVTIERRKGKLYLRATLPPKPSKNKTEPYQQKISSFQNATPAGLQAAGRQARKMGEALDLGDFHWKDWMQSEEENAGIWLKKFEEDHWQRTKRTEAALTTWKSYESVFKKLDCDRTLDLAVFLEVVKTTQPETQTRKKTCTYLYKLGKFAGIEGIEKIKDLTGSYCASAVQPRKLPSDAEIAEYRESIRFDRYRWFFGVLAAYGVRSHEVFRLSWEDFPVIRVLSGKTGERFVYPLYPEWAEKWKLWEIKLPELDLNYSNAKLGSKISGWFYDHKVPFKAYDLRHCYARRCFEFGLAPDWASGLMGHSLQVHLSTYRAWIDEATYRKAYEAVINRCDRPVPPAM